MTPDYFCNLDANLMRLDHLQRPELNKGTVDFVVDSAEEYWAQNPPPHIAQPYASVEGPPKGPRAPAPLDYVFAFDVSTQAVVSGFLKSSCDALKQILFGSGDAEESAVFPAASRIGIATFNDTLHFYSFAVRFHLLFVMCARIDLRAGIVPVRGDTDACRW